MDRVRVLCGGPLMGRPVRPVASSRVHLGGLVLRMLLDGWRIRSYGGVRCRYDQLDPALDNRAGAVTRCSGQAASRRPLEVPQPPASTTAVYGIAHALDAAGMCRDRLTLRETLSPPRISARCGPTGAPCASHGCALCRSMNLLPGDAIRPWPLGESRTKRPAPKSTGRTPRRRSHGPRCGFACRRPRQGSPRRCGGRPPPRFRCRRGWFPH